MAGSQLLGQGWRDARDSEHDWKIHVRWVDTQIMLADALTKTEAERGYIIERLQAGEWSLEQTSEAKAAKERIRAQRRARKAQAKRATGKTA